MNGKQLNKQLGIGAKHALYREDGTWYHQLVDFPGVLFDKNGYLIFNNKDEYLKNNYLKRTKDLHINDGISNVPGYKRFTDLQKRDIFFNYSDDFNEETLRIIRKVNSVVRKPLFVEIIKKMYGNRCQICGTRLEINSRKYYSEVHHLKPLGKPHNGPDKIENMICVCPNDHVLLDFLVIKLDIKNFKSIKHNINLDYIDYHNNLEKIR